MDKSKLQDGDKVILRNGFETIYQNGFFMYDATRLVGIDDYDDELNSGVGNGYDVMEIKSPSYETKATRTVAKMTVEEIKNIIGYDFEIVEK